MQDSLFSQQEEYFIPLVEGGLLWFPRCLPSAIADRYFDRLQSQTPWQQSKIRIAGRSVQIPRLNAWYGDEGAHYQYSGKAFSPLPWTRALQALKSRVQRQVKQVNVDCRFNSALLNNYRDGKDSVAWHADDESELGPNPVIASLSLGATRRFLLKQRRGGERRRMDLEHGSLLIMLAPTQANWLHCVPKSSSAVAPRINVTFRQVMM